MSNVATLSKPALEAGARPQPIIPTNIEQVYRLADAVSKSGMAPRGMEKPETITIAIMHGLEIGLTPLQALQRIAVINGRPAIWGDGAMGLVRASGLCEYVKEDAAGEGDKLTASCTVKRKGEADAVVRTFSVADAKRAKLWGKQGPWTEYPQRMLQMRARAFALRDVFADVLGGLYLAEELQDVPMKDATPRPPAPAAIEAPKAQTPPAPGHAPAKAQPASQGSDNDNPEALLKWIEETLAAVTDPNRLTDVWNDDIEPRLQGAFPPDVSEAQAIYSRHEKRLGID